MSKRQTTMFDDGVCALHLDSLRLNDDSILLAVATSDDLIRLYRIFTFDNSDDACNFLLMSNLKGHSDWVTGLHFNTDNITDNTMLASSSQDRFIRLWHFDTTQNGESKSRIVADFNIDGRLRAKVRLLGVLQGHDDWVSDVRWSSFEPNVLISAGMDKQNIIWHYDHLCEAFMERNRLGQVGGASVGYYGAAFLQNDARDIAVVANSYTGSLHYWTNNAELNEYELQPFVGGHVGSVTDLRWSINGSYLLTCSTDQTTRIFTEMSERGFVEIARPQVHGHDLQCLSSLTPHAFVSGADEKLLRVFNCPQIFVETMKTLAINSKDFENSTTMQAIAASVPSLGLSNRQVTSDQLSQQSFSALNKLNRYTDHGDDGAAPLWHCDVTPLIDAPTEQHLMQSTLWPEHFKLYGHPFEIFACDARNDAHCIASACRASHKEHAAIILWRQDDNNEWQCWRRLYAHQLTVTRILFEPKHGRSILSVSRDRKWALYRTTTDDDKYNLISMASIEHKCHSRIIWDCAWIESDQDDEECNRFVTVGRDKIMMIWRVDNDNVKKESSTSFDSACTSVAAVNCNGQIVMAIGLECGEIELGIYDVTMTSFKKELKLNRDQAHARAIRRLQIRRKGKELLLASCSDDFSVKIHTIEL